MSEFVPATSASQHMVTDVYTDVNGLQNLKYSDDKDAALKKVSQQFESLFVSMLLKSMRQANEVFAKDNPLNSNESKFYQDMHDQQLALSLAHGRGFGIADALYRQLSPDTSYKKTTLQPSVTELPLPSSKSVVKSESPSSFVSDIQPEQVTASKDVSSLPSSSLSEKAEAFVKTMQGQVRSVAKALGLDADMLIAQAALETGWGKRVINDQQGKSSFNVFNIKAGSRWQGQKVSTNTAEYFDGQFKKVNADFRSYNSIKESVEDYGALISGSDRYKNALKMVDDAAAYIKEIHESGYATDPEYSDKVISVYQRIKAWRGSAAAMDVANRSANGAS